MTPNEINVEKEEIFQNINYKNRVISEPSPSKIPDVDTRGSFYGYLMDSAETSSLDINTLSSFTSISRSRDSVYTLLDVMAEDPMISSAIKIYAADVCEPNDQGQIVWCNCDDPRILNEVNNLLDSLNVNKNSVDWVTSLIKYGDMYLRLYRQSDFRLFDRYMDEFRRNQDDYKKKKLDENYIPPERNTLEEDLKLFDYSKNDRYAEYMELVKNPAQVFDLQKYGKSYGYIKTTTAPTNIRNDSLQPRLETRWNYRYDQDDVEIYEATEFVHACLTDNSCRTDEEISLTTGSSGTTEITFNVRRGQSLLYNSFKIWRELTLLENAVLLNRITQSSLIRCVNVEVPDMDQSEAKNILRRVKGLFEQKSALNLGNNMQDYTNAGPIQNTIYIPTHNGIGNISVTSVGGDVQVGDLTDLDYWKNKLSGSLGIPKQYLGDTSDSTGFNGGSSLSIISSRYAKTVKSIQNIYLQSITDAVNLILLDKGLRNYINKFTLRMQEPTTQEEKDRRDNLSTQLNSIREIMGLVEDIENRKIKLEILKSLLSSALNNEDVVQLIQEEIDSISETTNSTRDELGDSDFDDINFEPSESEGPSHMGNSEPSSPVSSAGENETPIETAEAPAAGGDDFLETFEEMGVSYRNVL